ncbi:hypothetical protein R1sor_013201 [Riccia sorocarpa]|uniref:Uncharacterized protein n=1 Tax=Riccia sorocarpa TaxID=122646 RepID=A0ABD3H8S2_9MARC
MQTVKRRPGRPPGSGKKLVTTEAVTMDAAKPPVTPQKRRPGRPPGTKLKLAQTDAVQTLQNLSQQIEPTNLKRRKSAPPKRMELSVTINITGTDISPALFPLIQDFLQSHCEAGVLAVERRGSLLNLHLQGVVAMLCTRAVDAKKKITSAVGWANDRLVGAGVCVKKLTNKGIHTFVGGHYTPSTTWLINKGLDRTRMTAHWQCYIQPGAVTLADIDQVFFLDATSLTLPLHRRNASGLAASENHRSC